LANQLGGQLSLGQRPGNLVRQRLVQPLGDGDGAAAQGRQQSLRAVFGVDGPQGRRQAFNHALHRMGQLVEAL
jgi:hypothetical protein